MKTFTVVDQKRLPIKYEFTCHNGLLMEISSWGAYGNNQPLSKYSCRSYNTGKAVLNEPIFTLAVKAMLVDESFSDFADFLKAIENDELYLPIAKKLFAQQINIFARRIQHISAAFTNI